LALAAGAAPAAPPVPEAPRASPFWASARSLAFPAWGQLHNGSEKKAVVLFSLETYLLGRALRAERRAGYYDDRLSDASSVWERSDLERRRDDLRETRSDLLWWSSLLVLYAVIDAYVDAHLVGFDEGVERVEKVTAFLAPRAGGGAELSVGVRY
jgi:hypothetical protein